MPVEKFGSFVNQLEENSLYTSDAERAALVADKDRVAAALMFNFFGMLGMINAATQQQKNVLLKFFKKDKQMRLASIGDDNHDISLSVKLADEVGFFRQSTTAAEITRFLFKLKSGQVDHIDSTVVARWANSLVPEFRNHLKDPKMKSLYIEFAKDGGATIDVSRMAVELKKRARTVGDSGDFFRYAKRFHGLQEVPPSVAPTTAQQTLTPAAPDPVSTTDSAAQATGQAAGSAAQQPAPKLSYYQRQKLKKQAEKAAQEQAARKEAEERAAREAAEKQRLQQDLVSNVDLRAALDSLFASDDNLRGSYNPGSYSITKTIKKFIDPNGLLDYQDMPESIRTFIEDVVLFFEKVTEHSRQIRRGDTIPSFSVSIDLINKHLSTDRKVTFADIYDVFDVGSLGSAIGLVLNYHGIVDNVGVDRVVNKLLTMRPSDIREFYGYLPSPAIRDRLIDSLPEQNDMISEVSLSISRSWSSPQNYNFRVNPNTVFFVAYCNKYPQQFDQWVESSAQDTYTIPSLLTALGAFGVSDSVIDPVGDVDVIDQIRGMFKRYIRDNLINNKNLLTEIFDSSYSFSGVKQIAYDPNAPDRGGLVLRVLHDEFAKDVERNGFENSKLSNVSVLSPRRLSDITRLLGVDLDKMLGRFPSDVRIADVMIQNKGLNSVSTEVGVDILAARRRAFIGSDVVSSVRIMNSEAGGSKEENFDALAKILLEVAKQPRDGLEFDLNSVRHGEYLMEVLSNASTDTVLEWVRYAKTSGKKYAISAQLYKDLPKDSKGMFVEVLSGIVLDSIGTDVEDFVNDVVEDLAPHVKQKMRQTLVGSQVLIAEIETGGIKPFDKIDNNRLKQIFLYNDIDLSAIISENVGKKNKGETYAQFFTRAKQQIAAKDGILPKPNVSENTTIDKKKLNKLVIERDHAGRHGDVFPKIFKVFDGTVRDPEFDLFRETNFGDGSVVPAYHGTGGIAASMILRYGFKVIRSSDPSVVGRMLGDGIYFSNKIDKAMQYVSNGGYSRKRGQMGYIFQMDSNLGELRVNYRVAGLGGDNIRSPEWCVFDPKAQLRIEKVYEVELNTKNNVDKYLAEHVYSNHISTFKQYLKEQQMQGYQTCTTFVFRDGMIPIVDDENNVEYVDFQRALQTGQLPSEIYEATSQGPAVVFYGTSETEMYDERYASMLNGDHLQTYKQLFRSFVESIDNN